MQKSIDLLTRAEHVIPGGVNSPVRAFKSVGGNPVFFESGSGAYMRDVDGNRYIDYVGSWGPLILGHNHPAVIEAIQTQLHKGLAFGAPTELEVDMAELITKLMPSIEMVRMVNSGTEATMSAIRLARGFTGKNKIIKFDACYHGHNDSLLVKAGSGILTLGLASCAGVSTEVAKETIVLPYNDLAAVQQAFTVYGDNIAAIIVEPIAANNNIVLPQTGFLAGLRAVCDQYNSILIFDEVISGFRVALGGAQELYDIKADLTCLGKIIGGGLPVGAFGGRRDIMEMLAPIGPVYQAGTLSGSPIAMSAGIATLKQLQKPGVYQQLLQSTQTVTQILKQCATDNDIEIETHTLSGLFGFSFKNDPHNAMFNKFFHLMLKHGVYLAPSAFEAGFVSLAHDDNVLDETANAADKCFGALMQVAV